MVLTTAITIYNVILMERLSDDTEMDVHDATGTLLSNWKLIKALVGILMKQSVVKYFIL